MTDSANNTGLWASIAAAIPGFGALGWAIFRQIDSSRQSQTLVIAQESEEHKAEGARALLDDAQKEWFDGVRSDLRELRTENAVLRRDRDRGWDLARAWRELCREERHAGNNIRQKLGEPPPASLPGLEDVEGKKP